MGGDLFTALKIDPPPIPHRGRAKRGAPYAETQSYVTRVQSLTERYCNHR